MPPLTARAYVYFHLDNFEAARKDLEQAIAIDPDNSETIQSLVTVYRILGDPIPEAYQKHIYDLTIANLPGSSTSISKPLEPDEVIQEYDRIIALNPQSSYAYHYRAVAYINKGEYGNAIADDLYAIELNPYNIRPYLHLSVIYELVFEDYEQAVLILEQGIENNPKNPDLYYFLGDV